MHAARPILIALLLVLGMTATGCSAADTPQVWAASVCTTLTPWRAEIGTLANRTKQQMAAATSPSQAKDNLVRLFSGAETASEQARAGVERAGVPDVANGKRIAEGFLGSLAGMRDAYRRARSGVESLATRPADAFYQRVGEVVERLDTEFSNSSLDTTKLESVELRRAFDELPECQ